MESKEKRIFKKVALALTSNSIEDVKSALEELLGQYKKQTQRTDKILKTSDKLQEALLTMNERLTKINDIQEQNIEKMIADKRQRAKNIISSKTTLYEYHQQEVYKHKLNINKLTDLLNERDNVYVKYALLKKEFNELKKSQKNDGNANEQELEYELDRLKENGLDQVLLELTKKLIAEDIKNGFLDSASFSKRFLKILKLELENVFLVKYPSPIPKEKISILIIKTYLEDILSVSVDIIIRSAAVKVKTAVAFIASFNAKTTFNAMGDALSRQEIIDAFGDRWTPSSITQAYLRRDFILKQIQIKKEALEKNKSRVDLFLQEIDRLNVKIQTPEHTRNGLWFASKTSDELDLANDEMKVKFCKQLIAKNQTEASAQKQILANENAKLLLLENELVILNDKCDAIVRAFVKVLK